MWGDILFAASKLGWLATNPLVLWGLSLLVALIQLWRGRLRSGRIVLTLVVLVALVLVASPLGDMALAALEDRFPPPADLDHVDGIVVLGGAAEEALTRARGQVTLNNTAERMTEFVALARRHPQARLVFAGGSGVLGHPELREADTARRFFAEQGLDPARVVFEDESRNTRQNAVNARVLVGPAENERWLLVTSAFHMPRAVGCFRAAGWPVVPYPVDYRTLPGGDSVPGAQIYGRLPALLLAWHEFTGLVAYAVLGWTDALFPAPEPPPALRNAGGDGTTRPPPSTL